MASSNLIKRLKDSLRHRNSNASDGRRAQTPVPPEGASSSVADVSQSSPSPNHLGTPHSRTEQPQAAGSIASATPDQAPSSTVPPALPSPQATTLRHKAERSLWNRAYEALCEKDRLLVNEYEKILSKELSEQATGITALQDTSGQAETLALAENRISTDPDTRQAQLKKITDNGIRRAEEKQIEYTVFGHNFVLRDQVSQAAHFIKTVKGLVDEAVKVSPEASLAWAGVCVLLPVFTNQSAAEEANSDGLTYVTSRIRFYVELEHLLWPKNLETRGSMEEFESHLIDLYQHILEFQIKTVRRFYQSWLARAGRDAICHDNWAGMVSKIKALEKIVRDESSMVNAVASHRTLERMSKVAEQQHNDILSLLSTAREQAQVAKDLRDISSKHFNAQERTNRILEDRPIYLPIVHEARYDSADVQGSPKCEEGTRIRIQQTITQWADDPSTEPLFWLVGPAGTGKSTIARTVADSFHSKKRLAAGYFFKRGEQGRNDTSRLFPTLAMQLAEADPSFKGCLRKSLDNLGQEAVEKKALEFQFEKLLWLPMTGLPSTDTRQLPRVIVIDALDECERPEQLTQAVALLSKLCTVVTVRLRVLLTSRSDPKIIAAFKPFLKSKSVHSMELHREFPGDSKADIQTFLKARFKDIRTKRKVLQDPWPTVEELDRLVYLATSPEPLFIYAATLCRFVYDEKRPRNPKAQLKLWLKECEDNKSQLHQIYDPILSQVFLGNDEAESCQQLQFLGALVLLATPLSAASLACLLGIDMDDVNWWLPELHAVFDIPAETHGPIRMLHKSFSDFLLSPINSAVSNYQVDATETHAMLATKCIQRMQGGLKQDICDIRKLGASRDDIDQKDIDGNIPADLRYACLYWGYHLQRSGRAIHNNVVAFLYEHFLHWVEALSLLGRLSDGALALRKLREMIETNSELGDFLKDASRVISSFGSIIEHAPLQTYSTLLLFSPVRSRVRQRFWEQRLPSLSTVQGVKSHWDSHQQTLEGHDRWVTSVAFLPDGQTLASGSDDETVRLWDMATGAQKQMLEGHDDRVTSVAFSPDGQTLASGSYDKTARLWDMATGAQKQMLEGHDDRVTSVAFLPDGQMLASGSYDKTVRLWDMATGAQKQTLEGHEDWVISVAFSPDGQTLASGSYDKTVRLWDVATGAQKQMLEGHDDRITSVAFSPNGQTLASGSDDETVRLWDVATGAQKQTLEGHNDRVTSVAFSPNSQTLASGSDDKTVRLWDVATGAQKQMLEGHNHWVTSVAFSPNSQTLASGSNDKTVRLWDVATGAQKQTLEGFTQSLTFNPLSSTQLVTDFGIIDLLPGSLASEAPTPRESTAQLVIDRIGLSYNKTWIVRGNERIIWLPLQYRSTVSVVKDSMLCIGSTKGYVCWFTNLYR
ncbi:hypothetical protein F5883DRAFT_191999 [Diaporthe sp. PMI_573]|nr:hypothetical protein F5883DRAFT_191999 [Diaporthaceae sp. PMI_573]